MKTSCVPCADEGRRRRVREAGLSGIDAVEVGLDRRTLAVFFLGRAPADLAPKHFQIEGGRGPHPLAVERVEPCRQQDLALDDCVRLALDREGGPGVYRLRLVGVTPAVDPMYAEHEFSFDAGQPSELDCAPRAAAAPTSAGDGAASYLAKDYAGFRQLMLDRLALTMPAWRERHVPDLGIALVELLAYVGDHLSYYQDAVATEAYLGTARRRISVRRHARLIDYAIHEGCNARAWVCVETNQPLRLEPTAIFFCTEIREIRQSFADRPVPLGALQPFSQRGYEVFEPMGPEPIELLPGRHAIGLYTWGNSQCCLPRGATSATLAPMACQAADGTPWSIALAPGDFLIFEEVKGPRTGLAADADPRHRHVVRLTEVSPGVDTLYDHPIVRVAWAPEDALPFPLQISAIGGPPECTLIEEISVARGNVILVDHGRQCREELPSVPASAPLYACAGPGELADEREEPGLYRPTLEGAPLTFRRPLEPGCPAHSLLDHEPRGALPAIALTAVEAASEGIRVTRWGPTLDLLRSGPEDTHFVAEIDNDGAARLRFGDDELGRRPAGQTAFVAEYRVGNGAAGNVGAEAIRHLILRDGLLSGGRVVVRNPLPAQGGAEPERLAAIRLLAPQAAHAVRECAATAADYAELAQRAFPELLQRASARLHWTGTCYEVVVAIDPRGAPEATPELCRRVREHLEQYRRINHELTVIPARYVPLELALAVEVRPGYQRGHVRAELLDSFSARELPGGRRGLFHPDNLSFGDDLFVSPLVAAALAIPGVADARVVGLRRCYGPGGDALQEGVLRIGPYEIARLENDPAFPERGRLQLKMRGGR